MARIERLPVHCCCHPSLRLGYLEIPLERLEYWPQSLLVPLLPVLTPPGDAMDSAGGDSPLQISVLDTFTADVCKVVVGGHRFWAVKSAHQPIEVWRRVRGFIEDQGDEGHGHRKDDRHVGTAADRQGADRAGA